MTALKIEDMKQFTSQLFVGEVFDRLLVKEASIVTFNTFTIDGAIRPGYYSQEELEEKKIEGFSTWNVIKPFCFSLIKGKRLPESFRIVLQMPGELVESFLEKNHIPFKPEQVRGLYINIHYSGERLICVTGTSLSFFTMDKTLEDVWGQALKGLLKQHRIVFTEE